uniref:Uncharacterized protein n=1 Tax=Pyxicephalus adspersus TaxID=30357 RepID=A0AAV3AD51_PYXAD|nr:TPA: hypothetical protein GDO54_017894 [Pyxicephalus adspersus]
MGHKSNKTTTQEIHKRFCAQNLKKQTQVILSHCLTCARNNVQGKKQDNMNICYLHRVHFKSYTLILHTCQRLPMDVR